MARHAVEPVAAGDEVAFQRIRDAAFHEGQFGRGGSCVVELDILRLFDDPSAVALPKPVQFFGDRRLSMRPHRPAGVRLGVDEEGRAVLPDNEAAVMRMAFAVHPLARARVTQHLNGAVFKHAGADALEHIGFRLPLDDDAVDFITMQQMREEQASRTAADDRDLSAAHLLPPLAHCDWWTATVSQIYVDEAIHNLQRALRLCSNCTELIPAGLRTGISAAGGPTSRVTGNVANGACQSDLGPSGGN